MPRVRGLTLDNEQGSALLLGLVLIMIVTVLGVAFFEMATIEAKMTVGDASELQAFYCADAQAARIYNVYDLKTPNNPTGDKFADGSASWSTLPQTFPATTLDLGSGSFIFTGSATGTTVNGKQVVTVTATCTLPNGRSRTVQRNGTRNFQNPGLQNTLDGLGFNPATGVQSFLSTLWVGGADTITGDVYMSGAVYLRDQPTFQPWVATGFTDPGPRITTNCPSPPCVVNETNPPQTVSTGSSTLSPMPDISNDQKTGILDAIEAAVKPNGTPVMKGSFTDPKSGATTTVYNLTEIYDQLGTDSSSWKRNLRKPAACTFGVASTDPKCQIWQDLAILGLYKTSSATGPNDKPSYFFLGIDESGGTSDVSTIWSNAVNARGVGGGPGELKSMGFDGTLGSCTGTGICQRLNTLVGNVDGNGYPPKRIVDLTVGTDPITAASTLRSAPPIFYVDGYFRTDAGTGDAVTTNTFVYNGRTTVVATKSMIFSDNVAYLNGLENTNLDAPPSCDANDPTHCGAGDMVAFVAKEDMWMGDPNGTMHEVAGLLLAGRDFYYFDYNSSGACCQGPANLVTFNGTVMASRQIKMVRDWAPLDPPNGYGPDAACSNASTGNGGCRPVAFFPTQPSNFTGAWCAGLTGCWVFITLNADGTLTPDSARAAFNDGCMTTSETPLTPAPGCGTQANNTRRVTHFQLNMKYDKRLVTAPGLIPIAMPGGGGLIYKGLGSTAWKDCGANPHPGDAWSPERACPVQGHREDN